MPEQTAPIRFIILNGPPKSGKTTIARELAIRLRNKIGPGHSVVTDSFAHPMKDFVATCLGMKYADMVERDVPVAVLNGYSVREFLIDLSENYIKPRYNQDFWGRALYNRVMRLTPPPQYVICDDGGFEEELAAIPNHLLVRIERPGYTFKRFNDSRSFLPNEHYVLHNDSSVDDLYMHVTRLAYEAINQWPTE